MRRNIAGPIAAPTGRRAVNRTYGLRGPKGADSSRRFEGNDRLVPTGQYRQGPHFSAEYRFRSGKSGPATSSAASAIDRYRRTWAFSLRLDMVESRGSG